MGVYLGESVYNDSQVTQEWVEDEIEKNGKGVFFATYGQTTFQNILQEYNNGKIIVVKYEPATPGETTTYYFNLVRFNTETFDFVGVMRDGTIYRTGINTNDGWENVNTFKLDEIEFVEYNVDSYSTIKSYYDYGKFVVLKYQQQTPLVTKYYFYPLVSVDETNKEIVFGSLQLGQNNKKVTFTVTDSTGWSSPVESSAVVVDAALDSSSHNPVENMAIAAELTAINNKITGDLNDIFLALASKGVTVPAGAGLDDVAGLIEDVPTGGGPTPLPDNWITVLGIKKVSGGEGSYFNVSNNFSNDSHTYEIDAKLDDFNFSDGRGLTTNPNLVYRVWSGNFQIRINNGSSSPYSNDFGSSPPDLSKRHKIKINGSSAVLSINSVDTQLTANYGYTENPPTHIFRASNFYDKLGIYGFGIINNDSGEYVMRLIPVKNTVNNNCGWYDIITGTIYQAVYQPENFVAIE